MVVGIKTNTKLGEKAVWCDLEFFETKTWRRVWVKHNFQGLSSL